MTSPYNLLYEDPLVQGGVEPGWRVLVVAILQARSRREKVRMAMRELFKRWPTAAALAEASEEEVAEVCKTLWFGEVRAQRLINMSRGWMNGLHLRGSGGVLNLEGVGFYGYHAHALFVEGRTDLVFPDDPELVKYLEWRIAC